MQRNQEQSGVGRRYTITKKKKEKLKKFSAVNIHDEYFINLDALNPKKQESTIDKLSAYFKNEFFKDAIKKFTKDESEINFLQLKKGILKFQEISDLFPNARKPLSDAGIYTVIRRLQVIY